MQPKDSEDAPSASPASKANDFEPVKGLLQPTALAAVAASKSGKSVAFSGNNQVVLLDSETGVFKHALQIPEQDITQLNFSANGKQLYVGGGSAGLNGSVYAFDLQSGRQLFKIADESDSILALDVSSDGKLVALGGPPKLLKVFSTADGSVVHTIKKHTDWVMTTRFSPDGLLLASADRFGGLFIWEAKSGELFHALSGHVGAVHDLAWDIDGETLLSAGEDGVIRVWNMHHGTLTAKWDAEVGPILSLDRCASATLVAGRDGLVKAWRGPDDLIATYDAKEQVDHIESVGELKCVVTDSAGGIHFLTLPKLEPAKLLHLPVHSEARNELFVRLEKKSTQFELELRERERLAKEAAQTAASELANNGSMSQPATTPEVQKQVADTQAIPNSQGTNVLKLRSAIQSEIDTTAKALSEQVAQRDAIKVRLAKIQKMLEEKSQSVAETQAQLERLAGMLELAQAIAAPQNADDQDAENQSTGITARKN
ncbi:MAG TPA: hypothetical protein DDW52_12435 [Planctomycetaceae bacterium]|nr:hypothetical protein [Planctomycetaceae bacterium]